MILSQQVVPGMTLSVSKKFYRVDSSVKVTLAKGQPFFKMKLCDLSTDKSIEKNFKMGQEVEEVSLDERQIEFLYLEGKNYLFLDIGNLEQVFVPSEIIGKQANFLKEGVELMATFYGETVFSVELPQFLELMISKTDSIEEGNATAAGATKPAVLETGASVEVPPFIEAGDVIKVDTRTSEYIQRI
ncbi:MAG: Elongation factor P [Chlamydiales bacterium]|nr:Elongation factor P [Chlamydiales bacterium]MCH9620341.1 Elongation factor P [Chlamydiales bacterium]MCH9622327.1 Elongation factor P [Chlamydiales bacterium]